MSVHYVLTVFGQDVDITSDEQGQRDLSDVFFLGILSFSPHPCFKGLKLDKIS